MPWPHTVELRVDDLDEIASYLAGSLTDLDPPHLLEIQRRMANEVVEARRQNSLLPDSHAEEPISWGA